MVTTDELLQAITRHTAYTIACPDCTGTGTRFGPTGKSRMCGRCGGKRRLVMVPRDPAELQWSDAWKAHLDEPIKKWNKK